MGGGWGPRKLAVLFMKDSKRTKVDTLKRRCGSDPFGGGDPGRRVIMTDGFTRFRLSRLHND